MSQLSNIFAKSDENNNRNKKSGVHMKNFDKFKEYISKPPLRNNKFKIEYKINQEEIKENNDGLNLNINSESIISKDESFDAINCDEVEFCKYHFKKKVKLFL